MRHDAIGDGEVVDVGAHGPHDTHAALHDHGAVMAGFERRAARGGGGDADGTTCVGAHGERHQAGAQGRARARGGAAGVVRAVVKVDGRPRARVAPGRVHADLVLVHLADHDGAGFLELADRPGGFFLWAGEEVEAGVGPHAHGADVALDGNVGLDAKGDAIKGSDGFSGGIALRGGAGGGADLVDVDVEPGAGVDGR